LYKALIGIDFSVAGLLMPLQAIGISTCFQLVASVYIDMPPIVRADSQISDCDSSDNFPYNEINMQIIEILIR